MTAFSLLIAESLNITDAIIYHFLQDRQREILSAKYHTPAEITGRMNGGLNK
jgi:hypothetical protein